MAEQAVGGVRNAKDGNAARRGTLVARTPPGEVAKREPRTPWKALAVVTPTAGTRRRTLEGSEALGSNEPEATRAAHARLAGREFAMVASGMKPPAKAGGGRHAVETASPVGNDEGRAGPGNPMNPAAARIQDPKEP